MEVNRTLKYIPIQRYYQQIVLMAFANNMFCVDAMKKKSPYLRGGSVKQSRKFFSWGCAFVRCEQRVLFQRQASSHPQDHKDRPLEPHAQFIVH
jgi:hypothetical protein